VRTQTDWPDQREAARQLKASVRTLARARTSDSLDEKYYRHDGGSWRYDIAAIRSDPGLRCSTDGCDGVALGAGDKCSECHYSKPRVCPECGNPKAHHAELCRDCSADHGKLVVVQANAVTAKQWLHEQARERFRNEGELTYRETAAMLGTSYVPAKLEPVRVEVVAGAAYNLYVEPQVVTFRREWARGLDGRRRAWWQPSHPTLVLGARGDLPARAVRDAEQRARERHVVMARHRRGRKKRDTAPPHHLEWAGQIEELRDYYERQVSACQLDEVPGPWRLCTDLAAELFPGDPNGPARIYKAVTALKSLQISTN
jgi:hypothetical protein